MSELYLGPEHINAQLLASLVFADGGGAAAKIVIYSSLPGSPRDVPVGGHLAEVLLAKPCGSVAGESLTLIPESAGGTMILAAGFARWARFVRSDGRLVAAGTVSNAEGVGAFRLVGGNTPEGETTPYLQAGGLVVFGALTLG